MTPVNVHVVGFHSHFGNFKPNGDTTVRAAATYMFTIRSTQPTNYNKAIEISPDSTNAYNNRGLAYQMKDNADQAMEDCNQAIALDPNNAKAYQGRGLAYQMKDNADQAIADFTQAIALDPNNADAYVIRGNAYLEQDHRDLAAADFRKAEELRGGS